MCMKKAHLQQQMSADSERGLMPEREAWSIIYYPTVIQVFRLEDIMKVRNKELMERLLEEKGEDVFEGGPVQALLRQDSRAPYMVRSLR